MPSLVRFLVVVAVAGITIYAAMVALVTYVDVSPRPMEQTIPSTRLNR